MNKYIYHLSVIALAFFLNACQDPDSNVILDSNEVAEEIGAPPTGSITTPVSNQYMIKFTDDSFSQIGLTTRSSETPDPDLGVEERENTTSLANYEQNKVILTGECEKLLEEYRISPASLKKVFPGQMKGMVVTLSRDELALLEQDERIEQIEEDKVMAFSFVPMIKTPFLPSNNLKNNKNQVKPYGIDRVGGSADFTSSSLYNARWAWVVDTGVDPNHSDLNVDTYYSKNFSDANKLEDNYGHGTHVAGIIGAKDDGKGVVGIAAGAMIVNIKVLNDKGEGYYSDIVAGLDYIGMNAYPEDVVNISLGGDVSTLVDLAVMQIAKQGIKVVVAAGNSSQNVINVSPARVNSPNVYTVGAIDMVDDFTSFSNYGIGVDYAAPGQDILSTFKNGGYAYVSGTSMAAPHMAGVLILAGDNFITDGTSSVMPIIGQTLQVIAH